MHRLLLITLSFQGVYYLLTGVWPLLSIDTFELVTGIKYDHWLVKTVGALAMVIGGGILFGLRHKKPTPETLFLSVAGIIAFFLVDVVFVARGVIDPIYLIDAVVQAGLLLCLLIVCFARPKSG